MQTQQSGAIKNENQWFIKLGVIELCNFGQLNSLKNKL